MTSPSNGTFSPGVECHTYVEKSLLWFKRELHKAWYICGWRINDPQVCTTHLTHLHITHLSTSMLQCNAKWMFLYTFYLSSNFMTTGKLVQLVVWSWGGIKLTNSEEQEGVGLKCWEWLSGACMSINDERLSSRLSADEATWSEGKRPSCVATRLRGAIVATSPWLTRVKRAVREARWRWEKAAVLYLNQIWTDETQQPTQQRETGSTVATKLLGESLITHQLLISLITSICPAPAQHRMADTQRPLLEKMEHLAAEKTVNILMSLWRPNQRKRNEYEGGQEEHQSEKTLVSSNPQASPRSGTPTYCLEIWTMNKSDPCATFLSKVSI